MCYPYNFLMLSFKCLKNRIQFMRTPSKQSPTSLVTMYHTVELLVVKKVLSSLDMLDLAIRTF